MPDGNQQVATTNNQDLATMRFEDALEVYSPSFQAVLPPDVSLQHFKRMVVTAVNQNPDLRYADRRTLFNACVKCASDGVLPDGREAALVVFRTKVKDGSGNERWIDAVNYMIMVAGIRKRLRNTGEVLSAEAEVVYRNDRFRFTLGDNAAIDHEPAPLDQDPGDVMGAYAIIKLANGEVLREIVRLRDIERARHVSKAPNSPAWKDWYDQMARKVALRRCAKAAPSSSGMQRTAQMLERLLDRDEERPELPPAEEMQAIPPRPSREDFSDDREVRETTDEPAFALALADGRAKPFVQADDAAQALDAELRTRAQNLGLAGIESAWIDNAALISQLRSAGRDDLADRLHATRNELAAEHNSSGTSVPGHAEYPEGEVSRNTPSHTAERNEQEGLFGEASAHHPARHQDDARPRDTVPPFAVGVQEKPGGRGTDWIATKDALLARARKITDQAQFAEFHRANAETRKSLRDANKQLWSDCNFELSNIERELRESGR